MERLKNVYKVEAETTSGSIEKFIFSHSHDNAMKKMKVYLQRKNISILKIAKVEKIHENVIY